MQYQLSPEMKTALIKGGKVFVWAGLSAILPLIIAYMENDPKWVALAPVINAVFVAAYK